MSPVAQFEGSARTVWRSDLSRDEKAKRLKAVRSAIFHYMERLDRSRGAIADDPWATRSFERAQNYLKQLATDVETLAIECESTPDRKRARTPKPYVA